ncbi:hypothetical protein [Bdellovibrio sp. HCB2-146]|uniref:hypothetical protein n=1 Tax=Bdellovibrio sp. HCB2-146 TaxID=3394362 RepID=UPI0039BC9746
MKLAAHVFVHFISLTIAPFAWGEDVISSLQNSVGIRGATAITANEVTGSGFNAKQPDTMMLNYGLNVKNKPTGSWVFIIFDYNVTSGQQKVATGLTPSEVSVQRQEYALTLLSEPFFSTAWGQVQASIGYKMVDYSVDETTPNVALTNLNTRGPTGSLKLKNDFANQTDSLEADLEIYFPHHIRESDVTTGSNPSALGAEVQLKFNHKITPRWQLSLGLNYQYETIQFEGTGSRGTVNATDVRTQFTIPIELEYLF